MGDLLTARQYARRLNVHYNTVLGWIKRNLIPYEERKGKGGIVRYYIDAATQPPHTHVCAGESDPSASERYKEILIIDRVVRILLNLKKLKLMEDAENGVSQPAVMVKLAEDLEDLSE